MLKNFLVYACVVCVFGGGVLFLLHAGGALEDGRAATGAAAEALAGTPAEAAPAGAMASLLENTQHPLSMLLLQIVVIVVAARLVGGLFQKMGQPAVVGEMLAGILLGPSLLGWLFPGALGFLFPAAAMGSLQLFSQFGVILFMFIVGLELDLDHLRSKAQAAVMVSHASIVIPFFLGTALSLLMYRSFAPAGVSFASFALFMGIAMSITAFPVLARILEERRMSKSYLGSTALTCAAVDDVTAWCLLAVVVALVRADALSGAVLTTVLALLFILVMLFVIKPKVEQAVGNDREDKEFGKGHFAAALVFAFVAAWFTETIGIHALFGAFLAGVVMPPQKVFRDFLRGRLEILVSVFLLPLFFAFTGLRTQVGLLNDWQGWLICAGVIGVAILGKLGGSMLAARWTGMSWPDSFSIGALMNTRGLMELIVLNLGYDLGILSQKVFAILVLMALVTTCMTGPLLTLAGAFQRREELPDGRPSQVA